MIVCYDFEFVDDGRTTQPLSIGLVAGNGDELYQVFEDGPFFPALWNPWLRDNVLDKLPITYSVTEVDGYTSADWTWDTTHEDFGCVEVGWKIARRVERFLGDHGGADDVQLWADYPAHDHVVLCQLFGPMIECTEHGVPMRTSCLTQEEQTLRRLNSAPYVDGGRTLGTSFDVKWGRKPVQDPATEHHGLHDARHDMALARWLGVDR